MIDLARLAAMNGDVASEIAQSLGDPPPSPAFGALEEPIISLLLEDPAAFDDTMPLLTPGLFTEIHTKYVMALIGTLWMEHGIVPSRAVVRDKAMRQLTVNDCHEEVFALIDRPTNARESTIVRFKLTEFLRGKLLEQFVSDEATTAIATGDMSFAIKIMDQLMKVGRTKDRYTFGELAKEFPTLHEPVVDGLIRQGEIANVISHSKVGKSWLVYSLALAVVTGRPWLGTFPTKQGKVLLVDNELHPGTLAARIPKVAAALGIDLYDINNNLEVWTLRDNPKSLKQLKSRFAAIKPGQFSLIILDAKYRFIEPGTKEVDNADETQFYNMLNEIAGKIKAAIALVHHTTKGDQGDKRVTDVGSGAGAQSRAADSHLVLREHKEPGCVTLDAAIRSFAPIKPLVLRWEFPLWKPDTALDPAALANGRERQQQQDNEEGKGQIVGHLEKQAATTKEIRLELKMGHERATRLLSELELAGVIQSRLTKRKGQVCEEWAVCEVVRPTA